MQDQVVNNELRLFQNKVALQKGLLGLIKALILSQVTDGNKSLYLVFVGVGFFSQHLKLLLEQLGQHLELLLEQLEQQHLGCFVRTAGQHHLDCF
jgi:hypothetical protein